MSYTDLTSGPEALSTQTFFLEPACSPSRQRGSWQQPEWQRQPLLQPDGFMYSDSAISSDLIQAYLATSYHVQTDAPFVLKVGHASPDLARLYAKHRCNCAAYVTACNPFGRINTDHDNEQRHVWLLRELNRRSLHHLEGIGHDDQGQWPGEPSCLVLDLSLEAAKKLGRRYAQNALVWCGPDAIPLLVLLR